MKVLTFTDLDQGILNLSALWNGQLDFTPKVMVLIFQNAAFGLNIAHIPTTAEHMINKG